MTIPHLYLEEELWEEGYAHVAGVDEAGKGPWAGPVTAGAVIIHTQEQVVPLVRDSKLLSRKQREEVFDGICNKSSAYGIGLVEAFEIDSTGINKAVLQAMMLALGQLEQHLKNPLSYVLVDGSKTVPLPHYHSRRIKKGGLYHYSIAAGSILAKVTRDRIMSNYAKKYPVYGFEKHVGYGTKLHRKKLDEYGPCPIHRKSFAPVKDTLHFQAIHMASPKL